MLKPTDVFYNYSFIGIDPGLTQCGIAIFNINQGQLASIDALTLINNKIALRSPFNEEFHSDREIRSNKLQLAFQSILEHSNPILICCESPFYNPSSPSAFGSLTDTVSMLRITTNQFNTSIPFVCYSPQEVKQTFRRAGKLGKQTMKEALQEDVHLCSKLITPVQYLDEHSIDAVAVGMTYLLMQSL